jgi:transcriptional regulator with XRE-family HTH domain
MFTLLSMTTFKERLDEAVADKKMTTAEARAAFKQLGMGRSNLTHWFGGRATRPQAATLAPVADFLGVNAVWLASGTGPKRAKGDNKKMSAKLLQLSTDAVDVAIAYDGMEPHVQDLIRQHMTAVNEALGAPSNKNPFGKGRRPKKAAKRKRQSGTQ